MTEPPKKKEKQPNVLAVLRRPGDETSDPTLVILEKKGKAMLHVLVGDQSVMFELGSAGKSEPICSVADMPQRETQDLDFYGRNVGMDVTTQTSIGIHTHDANECRRYIAWLVDTICELILERTFTPLPSAFTTPGFPKDTREKTKPLDETDTFQLESWAGELIQIRNSLQERSVDKAMAGKQAFIFAMDAMKAINIGLKISGFLNFGLPYPEVAVDYTQFGATAGNFTPDHWTPAERTNPVENAPDDESVDSDDDQELVLEPVLDDNATNPGEDSSSDDGYDSEGSETETTYFSSKRKRDPPHLEALPRATARLQKAINIGYETRLLERAKTVVVYLNDLQLEWGKAIAHYWATGKKNPEFERRVDQRLSLDLPEPLSTRIDDVTAKETPKWTQSFPPIWESAWPAVAADIMRAANMYKELSKEDQYHLFLSPDTVGIDETDDSAMGRLCLALFFARPKTWTDRLHLEMTYPKTVAFWSQSEPTEAGIQGAYAESREARLALALRGFYHSNRISPAVARALDWIETSGPRYVSHINNALIRYSANKNWTKLEEKLAMAADGLATLLAIQTGVLLRRLNHTSIIDHGKQTAKFAHVLDIPAFPAAKPDETGLTYHALRQALVSLQRYGKKLGERVKYSIEPLKDKWRFDIPPSGKTSSPLFVALHRLIKALPREPASKQIVDFFVGLAKQISASDEPAPQPDTAQEPPGGRENGELDPQPDPAQEPPGGRENGESDPQPDPAQDPPKNPQKRKASSQPSDEPFSKLPARELDKTEAAKESEREAARRSLKNMARKIRKSRESSEIMHFLDTEGNGDDQMEDADKRLEESDVFGELMDDDVEDPAPNATWGSSELHPIEWSTKMTARELENAIVELAEVFENLKTLEIPFFLRQAKKLSKRWKSSAKMASELLDFFSTLHKTKDQCEQALTRAQIPTNMRLLMLHRFVDQVNPERCVSLARELLALFTSQNSKEIESIKEFNILYTPTSITKSDNPLRGFARLLERRPTEATVTQVLQPFLEKEKSPSAAREIFNILEWCALATKELDVTEGRKTTCVLHPPPLSAPDYQAVATVLVQQKGEIGNLKVFYWIETAGLWLRQFDCPLFFAGNNQIRAHWATKIKNQNAWHLTVVTDIRVAKLIICFNGIFPLSVEDKITDYQSTTRLDPENFYQTQCTLSNRSLSLWADNALVQEIELTINRDRETTSCVVFYNNSKFAFVKVEPKKMVIVEAFEWNGKKLVGFGFMRTPIEAIFLGKKNKSTAFVWHDKTQKSLFCIFDEHYAKLEWSQ